ncbi:hypothetical protein ACF0H5_013340 [Mactra antiquata]
MLEVAVFVITLVLSVIAFVLYLYPSSKNPSKVPGLDPVTKTDGNLGDLAEQGSLHEFLLYLHKRYGPIASFWWGPQYVVSIANDALFKEHHGVFDRPPYLFEMFKPFFGAKSITYANGDEWKSRRQMYDKCLTHNAVKKYYTDFQEIANNIVKTWEATSEDEHIPVTQFMMGFALKAVLSALFGEHMKADKNVLEFKQHYDMVWNILESSLKAPISEDGWKTVVEGRNKLFVIAEEMVKQRKLDPPKHGEELLLDLLIDLTDDVDVQNADALAYVVAGFHTTGYMLSWCLYYLTTHEEIQEKVYEEIKTVLNGEDVDHTNIGELVYLRQVIDETFRCAVIGPWAARFQHFDSELGGYTIPKDTPVIHALGVACKDENVFPSPDKFDPDRFSSENKKGRPHLAFSPFGFAGKRVCPGTHFAYAEGTVALVTMLRKFKIKKVEGLVIKPVHGLVTHPSDEIWITISKR